MNNLSVNCIVLVLALLSSYASIVDSIMFPHLRFLKLPCNSKNVTNSTMMTSPGSSSTTTSSVSVQESIYGTQSSTVTVSAQPRSSSNDNNTMYAIIGSIIGFVTLVCLLLVFRGRCKKTAATTKTISADNIKVVDTTPAVVKPAAAQTDTSSVAETEGSGSV